ncbi:hypothetical protein BC834DRAFT_591491 [Gloeopeniophorella convolvens]|nr:hypothetical protein BC834DRAFT_591491 [Gloeopeniophorella convolvens]
MCDCRCRRRNHVTKAVVAMILQDACCCASSRPCYAAGPAAPAQCRCRGAAWGGAMQVACMHRPAGFSSESGRAGDNISSSAIARRESFTAFPLFGYVQSGALDLMIGAISVAEEDDVERHDAWCMQMTRTRAGIATRTTRVRTGWIALGFCEKPGCY